MYRCSERCERCHSRRNSGSHGTEGCSHSSQRKTLSPSSSRARPSPAPVPCPAPSCRAAPNRSVLFLMRRQGLLQGTSVCGACLGVRDLVTPWRVGGVPLPNTSQGLSRAHGPFCYITHGGWFTIKFYRKDSPFLSLEVPRRTHTPTRLEMHTARGKTSLNARDC